MFIILLSITSASCVNEEHSKLNEYLIDAYGLSISADRHYYVFIPESGCATCVSYATEQFLLRRYTDRVTVLFLSEYIEPVEYSTGHNNVYNGDLHKPYLYDIYAYNVVVYETENKMVKRIHEVNSKTIEDVFRNTVLLN